MAKKKQTDTVYKIVEVVGVSEKSWEDAGRNAVETAAGSLRDLRVAEVERWSPFARACRCRSSTGLEAAVHLSPRAGRA